MPADLNLIFILSLVSLILIDGLYLSSIAPPGVVQEPSGKVAQTKAGGTGADSQATGRAPQRPKDDHVPRTAKHPEPVVVDTELQRRGRLFGPGGGVMQRGRPNIIGISCSLIYLLSP